MTSKDSLAVKRKFSPLLHEVWWTVRRYWWVSLVGMALIFLCTYGWVQMDGNSPDRFMVVSRNAATLPRIAGVLYGIFTAFCMFRFLWNRRECIMTLTVGTARWKQFILRYLFGLVSVILAVMIPLLLAHSIEMRSIGDDPMGICAHYTGVYIRALLTLAVLAYSVGVLIVTLCGNFLATALSTAGVLAAPYAVLYGLQRMMDMYLFGTPLAENLVGEHLNAGLFTMLEDSLQGMIYSRHMLNVEHIDYAEELKAQMVLPSVRILLLLLVAIGLSLIAAWAYCRRPAENAGKAYVHPALSHGVALSCGFGLSALALYIPVQGGARMFLLTALLVAAFLVAVLLLRLILVRDPREVLRRCHIPCGGAVVCLTLAILLGTGWFGYASYVPEATDVVSVCVSYNQNRALFPNLSGGAFSRGYPHGPRQYLGGSGIGDDYLHFLYVYGMEPRFESLPQMTEAEDIQKVLSIHETILDAGRQNYTEVPAEAHEDTVVNADYRIVYKLKNGKTVERYYRYLSLATLETTLQVEDTYAYRSAFYETHDRTDFLSPTAIELGDPLFSMFTPISLSTEEQKDLLKAIDTDTAMLTSEERYFGTGDPARDTVIGILRCTMVEGNIDKWIVTHPFDRNSETYYLTAAYENTLAFLAERGLTEYFENPYTLESVRIRPYTPRFYSDNAPSYVFLSCDNVVQALPEPSDDQVDPYDFYTGLDAFTTEVPEAEWDTYIQSSRPVALMTRPGVMVQIRLENAKGEHKLVTRYLYD